MNLQEEQGGETWLSPILVSLGFDSLANRSAPILRLRIFSGIFSTRPRREHLLVDTFLISPLVWVAISFDAGNGSEQNRAFRIDYRFERIPRTSRKKWHRGSFYENFKSETRDKAVGKYRTKGGLSVKMGIRRRSKGEIVRVDTRWRRLRCHYGALFMHHQPPGTFNGEQYREGYVNKVVPLLKNNLPRGQSGDEKI